MALGGLQRASVDHQIRGLAIGRHPPRQTGPGLLDLGAISARREGQLRCGALTTPMLMARLGVLSGRRWRRPRDPHEQRVCRPFSSGKRRNCSSMRRARSVAPLWRMCSATLGLQILKGRSMARPDRSGLVVVPFVGLLGRATGFARDWSRRVGPAFEGYGLRLAMALRGPVAPPCGQA